MKRFLSLAIVLVLILGSVTAVFAKDLDLVNTRDSSKNYGWNEFIRSSQKFRDVGENIDDYLVEHGGKFYSASGVDAATKAGKTFAEAIEGLTPVEWPEEPEEPEIPEQGKYKIVLSAKAKDGILLGDGYTNTTIEVWLVDAATDKIEPIDNLQVRLTTTYGQLSDSLVTLQKGYGHTTLNSEHVLRRTDVDLDAQVIEATVPVAYKENITGMTAKLGLIFDIPGEFDIQNFPRLMEAESNQADRVTLFFDRVVKPGDFTFDARVRQSDGTRGVKGYHQLEGNDPRSIEVLLEKDDYLTDNKWVYVDLELTKDGHTLTTGEVSFILTDNRKPQVTAIEHDGNMREITVYFSEAIYRADFNLDGGTNVINSVTYHDFEDGIDSRHIVTLDVEYLSPGEHKLQVSAPKDFAWLTDPVENIGTTQELTFTVLPDDAKPTARVLVESPEQYRIYLRNATLADDKSLQDIKLQIWDIHEDNPHNGWKEIKVIKSVRSSGLPNYLDNPYPDHATENYKGKMWLGLTGKKLARVTGYDSEGKRIADDANVHHEQLVVETNTDWTWVFDTEETKNNYYDFNKFRLVIPAGTFVNVANDLKNEEIILPIVLPIDDDSPKLRDIDTIDVDWGEFDLEFDEPIKGIGIEEDKVGETPSQKQYADSRGLPNIVVQYRGTNSAGKPVTIDGRAKEYVSKFGRDDEIKVIASEKLRDLVDYNCYGEDWTLVVMNVTDDIGNAAETVTHRFTVGATKEPARKFEINEEIIEIDGEEVMRTGIIANPSDLVNEVDVNLPKDTDLKEYDVVRVEYTDLIRLTGSDDSAIDKSNYKLNGRDLGEDSFILVDLKSYVDERYRDLCRYEYEGYKAVYIFTPEGSTLYTASALNGDGEGSEGEIPELPSSNTLEVNERLYSKPFSWSPGVKLDHPYEIELGLASPLELIPITGVEVTRGSGLLSSDTYYATVTPAEAGGYDTGWLGVRDYYCEYQWQKAIRIPDGSGWFDWVDVGGNRPTYTNFGYDIKVRVKVTGRNDHGYTGIKYSNEVEGPTSSINY